MSQIQKDFNCFYYSIDTTSSKSLEDALKSCEEQNVIIEELWNQRFFIEIPYESNRTSIIFSGKQDDDPRNLRPIDIAEWEKFFYKVFVYIDFSKSAIFQNSKWIISILKSGHEVSIDGISQLFRKVFSENNLWISTIKYKKWIVDFLEWRKLKKIELKFANPDYWRPIFSEWESSLESLWKAKEQLGGDILTCTIGTDSQYWITLDKFKQRFTGNKNYIDKASVFVADDFWKEIQQQVDELRFRDLINLTIKDRDFIAEQVKEEMWKAFVIKVKEIETEYWVTL